MQMRSDSDSDARSDSLRSDRRTNLAPDVSLTDIRLTVIQTPFDSRPIPLSELRLTVDRCSIHVLDECSASGGQLTSKIVVSQ